MKHLQQMVSCVHWNRQQVRRWIQRIIGWRIVNNWCEHALWRIEEKVNNQWELLAIFRQSKPNHTPMLRKILVFHRSSRQGFKEKKNLCCTISTETIAGCSNVIIVRKQLGQQITIKWKQKCNAKRLRQRLIWQWNQEFIVKCHLPKPRNSRFQPRTYQTWIDFTAITVTTHTTIAVTVATISARSKPTILHL